MYFCGVLNHFFAPNKLVTASYLCENKSNAKTYCPANHIKLHDSIACCEAWSFECYLSIYNEGYQLG